MHLTQHREVAAAHALAADHHAVADHGEFQRPVRGLPGTPAGPVVLQRAAGAFLGGGVCPGDHERLHLGGRAPRQQPGRPRRTDRPGWASAAPGPGSAAAAQTAASATTPWPRLCPARPGLASRLCRAFITSGGPSAAPAPHEYTCVPGTSTARSCREACCLCARVVGGGGADDGASVSGARMGTLVRWDRRPAGVPSARSASQARAAGAPSP